MADVAGTAVGSASLTMQLFNGAVTGYKVFTTAKNFMKDAGVLQAQLLIQEQLLMKWGDSLGLTKDENEVDDRLKTETGLFNAVVASLSSIKDTFLDLQKLKLRYGVESTDELGDPGVPLAELASAMLLHGNTLEEAQKIRKEYLEQSRKSLSKLKLLRWAVRDKEKFEDMIALLTYFNDGLYSLIPPTDARILAKAILAELLRTTDLDRLRQLQVAAGRLNSSIASTAGLRHLSLTMRRGSNTLRNMELSWSSQQLRIETQQDAMGQRSIGTYTTSDNSQSRVSSSAMLVMIEWKIVEKYLAGELRMVIESRINNLAHFLHQKKPGDLRALDCLGYIKRDADGEDNIKYGLIYSVPSSSSRGTPPVSLYSLLQDDAEYEFDLGDKFRTAQMLAESLYELHVSNWLHKGICSENVLYFKRISAFTNREPRSISTSSPFLSGYEFARPGRLREVTQKHNNIVVNCYAHPLYRTGNVRYHRVFDIYSLGVVLLELGIWRKIETGVSSDDPPEEVRRVLVETCEDELGPAMGTKYREVVRCCLQGDFPVEGLSIEDVEPQWDSMSEEEVTIWETRDERTNGDLAAAFYWKVVKMLGECRA